MKKEVTKLLLNELRNASYHSEELLGGCWSVNCGDCQYPEVNKAFEEAKKTLLNLAHVTEKALQKDILVGNLAQIKEHFQINPSSIGLSGKCKKGPLNPPIIFKSTTEAMDYIKNYKPKEDE